jgi:ABC-2 type transport system ATP-binding protein
LHDAHVGDVDVDGHTVTVKVAERGRTVMQVVRALDNDDMVPENFTVREPTLDDVFLSLTGHAAGDEPTPPTSERGAA